MHVPAPNPMNPPPLPHNRQEGQSGTINIRWFLIGLLGTVLAIVAVVYLAATSTHAGELDYELLETELLGGTIRSMTISGTEVSGDFYNLRQSYDGQVRGRNEAVPDGYTESDARPVTSFTMTIPDGEEDRVYSLASQNGVRVTRE